MKEGVGLENEKNGVKEKGEGPENEKDGVKKNEVKRKGRG